jgi:hypothetical protein
MRDAINNNPKVQLGILGALVVLAAIVLLPSMIAKKSSSDSGATTNTISAQATTPQGSVDLTVKTTQPSPGATSSATGAATGAPSATSVDPQALVPGPGLPAPVINAWKDGKTVVLLVVRNHAIDDRLVRSSVRVLRVDSNVAVFVAHANRVARYSRITQGVNLGQVPALIVVRPRRLTGSVPEAQVAYGFRDFRTVVQYVHDALYSGKDDLPYSPR